MDAEWRREKLAVLLEKVDRGSVNGIGCGFYNITLATLLDSMNLLEGKTSLEGFIGTQTHVPSSNNHSSCST